MEQSGANEARIFSALLDMNGRDGATSQRGIARELGIALGLVNVYLKRCSRKGLIKISQAPARRYAYYLTPQGMVEKTRLTAEYLSYSLSYFRDVRTNLNAVLAIATTERGWRRIALCGAGELAEIALICCRGKRVEAVVVIDPGAPEAHFGGVPVVATWDDWPGEVDGWLVTDLKSPQSVYDALVARFGARRVLCPGILGIAVAPPSGGTLSAIPA